MQQQHYVEFDQAYRSKQDPYSGGYVQASTQVKQCISALTKNGKATAMWIGYTSSGVDGLRGRWNSKYKLIGMQQIAIVYVSETSIDFARNMEALLIEFYVDHVDNLNAGGGGPVGQPPYIVYVAWTEDPKYIPPPRVFFDDAFRDLHKPFVGGYQQAATQVKQSVSALVRPEDIFYVGITSGGVDGCRSRWNQKYKLMGFDQMAMVYESSSPNFVRQLERSLVDFYKEVIMNPIGGGGGGQAEDKPPYVVYVAWLK